MLDHDIPEIGPAELICRLQDLGQSHSIAQELSAGRNVTLSPLGTFRLHPYMPRPGLPNAAVTFEAAPKLRNFLAPPAQASTRSGSRMTS